MYDSQMTQIPPIVLYGPSMGQYQTAYGGTDTAAAVYRQALAEYVSNDVIRLARNVAGAMGGESELTLLKFAAPKTSAPAAPSAPSASTAATTTPTSSTSTFGGAVASTPLLFAPTQYPPQQQQQQQHQRQFEETAWSKTSGVDVVGVDDQRRMSAVFSLVSDPKPRMVSTIPVLDGNASVAYPTAAFTSNVASAVSKVNTAAKGLAASGGQRATINDFIRLPDDDDVYVAFVELVAICIALARIRGYDEKFTGVRLPREQGDLQTTLKLFERLVWIDDQYRGRKLAFATGGNPFAAATGFYRGPLGNI
jgi:hypothetical protein